jgi:hypothetical protein
MSNIATILGRGIGEMYLKSRTASSAQHAQILEDAVAAHSAETTARSERNSAQHVALNADAAADQAALEAIKVQFTQDVGDVYQSAGGSMAVNLAALVTKSGDLTSAIQEALESKEAAWDQAAADVGDFAQFQAGYDGEQAAAMKTVKAKGGFIPEAAAEVAAEGGQEG